MIISHRHEFIFLKSKKTAGTSVEISLSRYCGPDDVITPISEVDEVTRTEAGGRAPQHHSHRRRPRELRPRDVARTLRRRAPLLPEVRDYWNHIGAAQVRQRIGPTTWDRYFTFSIVRNPWDRTLSLYHWRNRDRDVPLTLDEFLERHDPADGFEVFTIDGEVAVDYVARYETLDADLAHVCTKLDIPFDGWMPRAKGGVRSDRRPYQEVLTPDQAASIAERCAREIELFGYTFDG